MAWQYALMAAGDIGQMIVGIQAAKEAGRINERTAQKLIDLANTYEKELEGVLPKGTVDPITLEQFKADVEKYVPEASQYVPENTPQQVTEGGSAEEMQAQKEALRQYGQLAKTGYDPIAEAQQQAAMSASAAQASSARQAALREAAQRGMGGTGLDVLAGLGATEQQAVAGRQAALQAQAEAGQRRLQALGQYGNMAGQMRQQTTGVEQSNVGIMNAFNERAARNLNQYNQYVSEMKNQAQLTNLQNQQRRDEQNVGLRNQQLLLNVQREEAAREARRSARERNITGAYGIRSGIGKLQAQSEGQALEKQTGMYGKAFDSLSNIGEASLKYKSDKNKD
jgi:hypothetical protein